MNAFDLAFGVDSEVVVIVKIELGSRRMERVEFIAVAT